jgi:hypothetical protein
MAQYPYGQGPLTREQAVEFVASVAYPNEKRTVAKKRVRSAIRYAIATRKLSAQKPYVAGDFFSWAVTKWPEVRAVEGLPLNYTIRPATAQYTVAMHPAAMYSTPSDPEELRRVYTRTEVDRQRLEKENEALRRECGEWRLKEQTRRDNSRAAGRLGKGVRRSR